MRNSDFGTRIKSWIQGLPGIKDRIFTPGSPQLRVAGGAYWMFLGSIATSLSGLLGGIAVARMIGKAQYGELGIVLSTYALFSQLGSLGLGVATLKFVAEFRTSDPAKAGRLAGFAMLVAVISFGLAGIAVELYSAELAAWIKAPHLRPVLRVMAGLLFVMGLDSIQNGVLSGLECFRRTAVIGALRAIVNLTLTVAGAWLAGLQGVVCAMVVTALVGFFLNTHAMLAACREHGVRLSYALNSSELRSLLHTSIPNFVGGCLTMPVTWLVNTMVVRQPNGYSDMALLNAASQWRGLAVLVPTVSNSAFIAIQSSLFGMKAHGDFRRTIWWNLKVQGACSLAVAVFLVIASPIIMRLYGSEFRHGAPILALLAASWMFLAPSWIMWNSLLAAGRAWWGLFFNAVGASLLIALSWMLIERGPVGIGLAFLIAGLVQTSLQFLHFSLRQNKD